MSLTLYAHPFSSYCQKVLIALYENDIVFTYRTLEDAAANEERAALWPFGRFPVLVDNGRTVAESSISIEQLTLFHPGPVQLVPENPKATGCSVPARRFMRAAGVVMVACLAIMARRHECV